MSSSINIPASISNWFKEMEFQEMRQAAATTTPPTLSDDEKQEAMSYLPFVRGLSRANSLCTEERVYA